MQYMNELPLINSIYLFCSSHESRSNVLESESELGAQLRSNNGESYSVKSLNQLRCGAGEST